MLHQEALTLLDAHEKFLARGAVRSDARVAPFHDLLARGVRETGEEKGVSLDVRSRNHGGEWLQSLRGLGRGKKIDIAAGTSDRLTEMGEFKMFTSSMKKNLTNRLEEQAGQAAMVQFHRESGEKIRRLRSHHALILPAYVPRFNDKKRLVGYDQLSNAHIDLFRDQGEEREELFLETGRYPIHISTNRFVGVFATHSLPELQNLVAQKVTCREYYGSSPNARWAIHEESWFSTLSAANQQFLLPQTLDRWVDVMATYAILQPVNQF